MIDDSNDGIVIMTADDDDDDGVVIVIDLEAYASRYAGYTKIQRLLFIAQRSA